MIRSFVDRFRPVEGEKLALLLNVERQKGSCCRCQDICLSVGLRSVFPARNVIQNDVSKMATSSSQGLAPTCVYMVLSRA